MKSAKDGTDAAAARGLQSVRAASERASDCSPREGLEADCRYSAVERHRAMEAPAARCIHAQRAGRVGSPFDAAARLGACHPGGSPRLDSAAFDRT